MCSRKEDKKGAIVPDALRAPANLKTSPKDITRKVVCVRTVGGGAIAGPTLRFYYYLLLNNHPAIFIACKHLSLSRNILCYGFFAFYYEVVQTGAINLIASENKRSLQWCVRFRTYSWITLGRLGNSAIPVNKSNKFQKRVNRIPVEWNANSRVGKARGLSGRAVCLHAVAGLARLYGVHIVYCTQRQQRMICA